MHHQPAPAQRHRAGQAFVSRNGPDQVDRQHPLEVLARRCRAAAAAARGPSVLALWTSRSIGPTSAAAAPGDARGRRRLSPTSAGSAWASPPAARIAAPRARAPPARAPRAPRALPPRASAARQRCAQPAAGARHRSPSVSSKLHGRALLPAPRMPARLLAALAGVTIYWQRRYCCGHVRPRRRGAPRAQHQAAARRARADPAADGEARRAAARHLGQPRVRRRQPDARGAAPRGDRAPGLDRGARCRRRAPRRAFYPRGALPVRERGQATLRKLLPDAIPGMEIDRIELPPRARMAGMPHTPARAST